MKRFTTLAVATAIGLVAAPAFACDGKHDPEKAAKRAAARAEALAEADADGNGALSAQEFEAFSAAMQRQHSTHQFAKLDSNDDGQVSADELAAPRHKHD